MLQDDSMNVPIVMQLPTPSEIGMWDGMEQPQAPSLACLSCHGLMLCVGAQDVAIAHGYNNLRWTVPQTVTVGSELPLNQLTELMRLECAMAGFTEILTWALLSQAENFGHLQRQDDGTTAVSIGNPATAEFEVCRTSLLPGAFRHLLMCVRSEVGIGQESTCSAAVIAGVLESREEPPYVDSIPQCSVFAVMQPLYA